MACAIDMLIFLAADTLFSMAMLELGFEAKGLLIDYLLQFWCLSLYYMPVNPIGLNYKLTNLGILRVTKNS